MNKILLSFDVEEFDLPEEYGESISQTQKNNISKEGLKKLLKILDKHKIKSTFFTTTSFASENKELIKNISKNHEIASHSLFHTGFKKSYLKDSKIKLEKIIGKKIKGFRMPRLQEVNQNDLKKAGYSYDSSLNPCWIPGRYNNFTRPRKPFKEKVWQIPVSVSPILRIPLFWISFKNLPLPIFKRLTKINLKSDEEIVLYFHPWEFEDLSKIKIPFYIKKNSGSKMLEKLDKYISWLSKEGKFLTFSEYLDTK